MTSLPNAIKALHARKDRSYGAAWKRRGERISVLPNIARKVDRLVVFAHTQMEMQDEPILDTAVDLLVYCGKYLLFLVDLDSDLLPKLQISGLSLPLSDHVENFDQLLDLVNLNEHNTHSLLVLISDIERTFETLWPMADAGSTPAERFAFAFSLWRDTAKLIAFVVREQPGAIEKFIESEISISMERQS